MKDTFLKIGESEFNVDEISKWTKEKFIETYKDLTKLDLDNCWHRINECARAKAQNNARTSDKIIPTKTLTPIDGNENDKA